MLNYNGMSTPLEKKKTILRSFLANALYGASSGTFGPGGSPTSRLTSDFGGAGACESSRVRNNRPSKVHSGKKKKQEESVE